MDRPLLPFWKQSSAGLLRALALRHHHQALDQRLGARCRFLQQQLHQPATADLSRSGLSQRLAQRLELGVLALGIEKESRTTFRAPPGRFGEPWPAWRVFPPRPSPPSTGFWSRLDDLLGHDGAGRPQGAGQLDRAPWRPSWAFTAFGAAFAASLAAGLGAGLAGPSASQP